MKLAHISDIHILSLGGHGFRAFLNKRLAGGANILLNRRANYKNEVAFALVDDMNARGGFDHVCITGDLTSLALKAEFEIAGELLAKLRGGPPGVSLIPGNHDFYTKGSEREKSFETAFGHFMKSDVDLGTGGPFPYLHVRGDAAIVGLSTGIATGLLFAYGVLGEAQLAGLERALTHPSTQGKARVVLIHHPPVKTTRFLRGGRSLRDAAALGEILKAHGAELVLHGHEHEDLAYDIPGRDGGSIPVRGVPSASYVGRHAYRHARYHIYELLRLDGAARPTLVSREVRSYQAAGGGFADVDAVPLGVEALRT